MMAGTNPAIARLNSGGYVVAAQGSNGHLWVASSGYSTDLGLPVRAGTSPAITTYGGSGYEIAYQGSNGDLWGLRNGGQR